MKKICIKCKEEKEEELFPFQSYVRADGERARRTECKSCINKKRDERRKNKGESLTRKEAQKKRHSRRYHENEEVRERMRKRVRDSSLKRKYGITQDDYQEMLDRQDGCCKICGTNSEEAMYGVLAVDHCHNTGRIRGLLCNDCNVSLGKMKDNPELLRRAANYLENKFDNN